MEEKKEKKNEFFHDCTLVPNVPTNLKKEEKVMSFEENTYIAGVH